MLFLARIRDENVEATAPEREVERDVSSDDGKRHAVENCGVGLVELKQLAGGSRNRIADVHAVEPAIAGAGDLGCRQQRADRTDEGVAERAVDVDRSEGVRLIVR